MSTIRKVINSLDNSDQKLAEIRENLKVIMELAESKAQIFEQEIQLDLKTGKTIDDLTVPITKVVKKEVQYRATAAGKTSDIFGEVATAVQSMISDASASGIVKGVAKIATSALDTIMGVAEGEEQVVKLYAVVTDYPAIVRFDFAFWSRKISAKSLKQYCETALACVAYKSAVDVTKLAFNDFLALYGPVLNAGFGNDPKKMMEMIQKAKEVYALYLEKPGPIVSSVQSPLSRRAGGQDSSQTKGAALSQEEKDQCLAIVKSNSRLKGIAISPAQKAARGDF